MDIVGSLPVEIVERIFSLLEPKDLAHCSGVNKLWYFLANSDYYWHKLCANNDTDDDIGIEPLSSEKLPKSTNSSLVPSRWKICFIKQADLANNWARNQCKRFDLNISSEEQVVSSSAYYSTLFIGYANNKINIYTVRNTGVTINQSLLELIDHKDVAIQEIVAHLKILVAVFWSFVLIYKATDSIYSFSHILYKDENRLSWSKDKKSIAHAVDIRSLNTDYSAIGLAGDILFLYDRIVKKVFLWDCRMLVTRTEINVDSQMQNLIYFKRCLYLGNNDRIFVYDITCEVKLAITADSHIERLFCNNKIILAKLANGKLCAWGRRNGEFLFTREMNVPGTCILSPTQNVLIYLLYSRQQPPEVDKRVIKAVDLNSQATLWRTIVQKSHFNVIGHVLHIVVGRYLVFYTPTFGKVPETCAVYDTVDGRYLYTIEKDYDILLCTNQLVLLRKGYQCSSVKVQLYNSHLC